MNKKEIDQFIKSNEIGRKVVGDGLYIRVQTLGVAYWEARYSINGKRRFMTLEKYLSMSLADAKVEAGKVKQFARAGIDPLAERERLDSVTISTVDDLFDDWYQEKSQKLKHPEIPMRIYTKEIKPFIGQLKPESVNARDIRAIIHKVAKSNRPSIANDTLIYCKQIFNHACKLDLIPGNPASAFNTSDAGGVEKSRTRALSFKELQTVFRVLRENSFIFTRDNYLALALLVSLGVRKGELIAAQWSEFDFEEEVWRLPAERSKTGIAITIPLSSDIIPWFKELFNRAAGSDYVFPARRASKRRAYISSDTLNHALAKIFGKKVDGNKQPYDNLLGQEGVEHFTVHDLRRTCRSLLSEIGVQSHIAERCLNHKLKGVEGIYDRYDFLDERRVALNKLASMIIPMVNGENNVTTFRKLG